MIVGLSNVQRQMFNAYSRQKQVQQHVQIMQK